MAHTYNSSTGEIQTANLRALLANQPSSTDKLQISGREILSQKTMWMLSTECKGNYTLASVCTHTQNLNAEAAGMRDGEKSSPCGRELMSLGSQRALGNFRDTRKDSEAKPVPNNTAMRSSEKTRTPCM